MGSAACLGSLPLILQEMELPLQLLLFSLQTQTLSSAHLGFPMPRHIGPMLWGRACLGSS